MTGKQGITRDLADIKRVKEGYQQLCTHKPSNLDQMDQILKTTTSPTGKRVT